MENVVTFVCL